MSVRSSGVGMWCGEKDIHTSLLRWRGELVQSWWLLYLVLLSIDLCIVGNQN